MKQRVSLLLALALLISGSAVFGQGTTSRLIGTVLDPTSAAVAGATVKLTNEGTNATFSTKTADNGAYFFEAVQSGLYTVTVEAQGFKKFASKANRVSIGQPATVNVTLELGSLAEVVDVAATAEVVQTSTSGNNGNLFSDKVISDLPIVGSRGRNPLDLVTRQPGVVSGANTGGGVHVNGARDRSWNYTIDGIDANETSAGGSNFAPIRLNPDALAEFRVMTGNGTAEFGRNSGGQVAMVTKSGTNQLHGTLFEFYRTPRFSANEWESNVNGLAKKQYQQHIPGGSVGGAIIKNKLFYYANLQFLRTRESGSNTVTVYTKEARAGNWRYVKGARNQPYGVAGASVDAQGNVISGLNIGNYNVIASDPDKIGWNSTTQGVANAAPLPNNFAVGDGLNLAGFTFASLQMERQHDLTTKIDYILNSRNTIFGRYSMGEQNSNCDRGNGGQPVFPNTPCLVNTMRNPKNFALNWRSSPTTSTTNEMVFGLNKFAFNFENPNADYSKISFSGTPVANPFDYSTGNQRELQTWQFVDNFAWFRGAHSIKFGTNLRFGSHTDTRGSMGGYNVTQIVDFSTSVNTVDTAKFGIPTDINSNDLTTLRSSINFMLGRVGNTNRGFISNADSYLVGLYNFKTKFNEYDFFVQDTWKVNRNLTIDAGLRLEMKLAPSNSEGRIRMPSQIVAAGAAPSNTLKWVPGKIYGDRMNNFGPSIGFAWDPFGTGRTAVRANYRTAYDRINTYVFSSTVFQNLPGLVIGDQNSTYGQNGGRLASLPVLNAPTAKPGDLAQPAAFSTKSITVVDPNFKMPTTHQWSFGIQREIFHAGIFEVNYIGRHAYHLFGAYNVNQVEVRNNGFLTAMQTAIAGGESPLLNQIMSADSRRSATETGAAAIRRLYPTDVKFGNVSGIAQDLARRTVSGKGQVEAAGLSPYFFLAYPQFAGGVNVVDSNDISNYHAFQVQFQRRMTKGLEYQISYTLAKSLDTRSFDPALTTLSTANSQGATSTPFDINNRRLNYGLSDFDRKHIIQSYWVYELPFGKGKLVGSGAGPWLNRLIGGWQLAGMASFQGGRPMTVFSGYYTFGNIVQSFANCNGCTSDMGKVIDSTGGVTWLFSPEQLAKFSAPAAGELGNTGRNFFRGPGSMNFDSSLSKRTRINERIGLEFRADATNLTNTPTFGFPTATFSSSTFGRIRDTVSSFSRKVQLGAKLSF